MRPRLWRALGAAGALTLTLGGCSMSGQLDSLFGDTKSERTGSVTPSPGSKDAAQMPPAADLAYARAAASALLSRGEKDTSMPWENPGTGTRGTVTPIASAYTMDGQTCRDFLASFVTGNSQNWVQGEACKQEQGAWEVRALKPWKRS
jgi:surface antigen